MQVHAEVAELADAPDSKSGSLRGVWVRFPPSALDPPDQRPYAEKNSRPCSQTGVGGFMLAFVVPPAGAVARKE